MNHEVSQPTEPPGEGWQLYTDSNGTHPPDASPQKHLWSGAVLEIWKADWGNETAFVTSKTLHPGMNVAGLYWRVS